MKGFFPWTALLYLPQVFSYINEQTGITTSLLKYIMGIFLCRAIFSLRVKIKEKEIIIPPYLCLLCSLFLLRFKLELFTPFWGLESTADEEQHTMPARHSLLGCEWGQQRLRCNSGQQPPAQWSCKMGKWCQSATAKVFLVQILADTHAISSNTLRTAGLTHLHETRISADNRYRDEQENRALISGGKKPCCRAWKRRTESGRRPKQRRAMWGKRQY